MTTYVDPAVWPFSRMIMCHMWADTLEELFAMIAIAESEEIAALPPGTALSATIAGSLTGVVGSLLAQVRPDSRDELMKVIEDWLPQAREQAESILISGQRR